MRKVIMVILDGFGINSNDNSYIKEANMECYQDLIAEYPNSVLQASGDCVGLPDYQASNSEIGHLVLGAGKKIKSQVSICNEILGSTLIEKNEKLLNLIRHVDENNSTLHLIGLISDGGIHSDIKYMINLFNHLKTIGVKKILFHAITDGKDVMDKTALKYIEEIDTQLKISGVGKLASICGRYYVMDTEEKWERIKVATDMLLKGVGVNVHGYKAAINACYKRDVTDAFIPPIILQEDSTIKENDGVLWLNFRSDSSKELLTALTNPEFNAYRIKHFLNVKVTTVMPVEDIGVDSLIDNQEDVYSLGTYFSDLGLKQARIGESHRFAHVTHIFNGNSQKLKNCDNYLIPSLQVKSYENHPGMSAEEITLQAIKCIEKDYDFILVNYANPDILGHTGNREAALQALTILDRCLASLVEVVDNNFYKLIVVSEHGNIEEMVDNKGGVIRTHTLNPVPFIIRDKHVQLKHKGDITQVAPTILKYMDIAIPKQMSGTKALFQEEE